MSRDREIYEKLPVEQKRVLCYMAMGFTCKTTAFKMRISPKTVEYHRRRIYQTLGLQGGEQDPLVMATRFAIRVGAVGVDIEV